MLRKTHIVLLMVYMINLVNAQNYKRNMFSANTFRYKQKIYVYGYEQEKAQLKFKCLSFTNKLELTDSCDFNLGNHTPADFVQISTDTLHDVLNFYFQPANQKNTVTLFRVNDSLRKICSSENYDANHINSISVFDDEKYYTSNNLYIIRSGNNDSVDKQFYLSKYQIQSMSKPFEYDFKWQFAFDRQYIHRAAILYADSFHVLIYAHVKNGSKKGQWILRINSQTGQLIKGTRLNGKIDERHYLVSNFIYNKKTRSIDLIGSIYGSEMINFSQKTYNFVNLSKRNTLFFISIDSLGEITSKTEKLIALPLQTNTGNSVISYHLKIRKFKKINGTDYDIWSDLYELTSPTTLAYYTSWHITIKPDDVGYAITPDKFFVCTKTLPKLINPKEDDTYGKFIMKDISEYDKFKYHAVLNPVIIETENDEFQNPFFILKKTDFTQAKKTYYYVFVGKRGLENKSILNTEQGQKSAMYFTQKLSYISFMTTPSDSEFELRSNKL